MKRFTILPAAGALAVALASCGGAGSGSSAPASAPSTGGKIVSTTQVGGVGKVLVDAQGMALYTPDGERAGNVRCTGACTQIWKPLSPGSGKPTASSGAGKLGVIKRPDGTRQVTAGGKPLYTFVKDSPGAVNGNGASDAFGAKHFTWHVVMSSGAAAGASSSAPASGGGGYSNGY